MATLRSEEMPIAGPGDVVLVRQAARRLAVEAGLGLVDQTRIVTAASELARNTLDYGGGGTVRLDVLEEGRRLGLRLCFEDRGPGIADAEQALSDGYTTGGGLGMGLSGSRRLVHDFEIRSEVGVGTRVVITRWK